jgi:hypothetical protein
VTAVSLHIPAAGDTYVRVRVPDGRVGKVIGFYRRQEESVLVRLPCGALREFLAVDVEALLPDA